MKSIESIALGYCPHCATHGAPNKCGIYIISESRTCRLDPHYGEWLRVNFGLPGPRMADGLGIFDGVQPRGKK